MDNQTTLHWAAEGGHLECAKALVEGGANLNASDECDDSNPLVTPRDGRTPAQLAKASGNGDVADYLEVSIHICYIYKYIYITECCVVHNDDIPLNVTLLCVFSIIKF